MGQYYFPVLVDRDGKKYRAYSHDFGDGLKLMEHSWVGNDFVNAVLGMIEDTPMRLAWVGDYSTDVVHDDTSLGEGFIVGSEAFKPFYEYATSALNGNNLTPDTPRLIFDMAHPDCFLANLTKKVYVDLERYVKDNMRTDEHGFEPYCVNPIPLLTSIGNGQGGGDYCGENEQDVGKWAFDELYISTIRPGMLEEVTFHFSE